MLGRTPNTSSCISTALSELQTGSRNGSASINWTQSTTSSAETMHPMVKAVTSSDVSVTDQTLGAAHRPGSGGALVS